MCIIVRYSCREDGCGFQTAVLLWSVLCSMLDGDRLLFVARSLDILFPSTLQKVPLRCWNENPITKMNYSQSRTRTDNTVYMHARHMMTEFLKETQSILFAPVKSPNRPFFAYHCRTLYLIVRRQRAKYFLHGFTGQHNKRISARDETCILR